MSYRLDVYIHDYFLKRKLHASAKAFMSEGKVATDPVGNVIFILFIYLFILIKFEIELFALIISRHMFIVKFIAPVFLP